MIDMITSEHVTLIDSPQLNQTLTLNPTPQDLVPQIYNPTLCTSPALQRPLAPPASSKHRLHAPLTGQLQETPALPTQGWENHLALHCIAVASVTSYSHPQGSHHAFKLETRETEAPGQRNICNHKVTAAAPPVDPAGAGRPWRGHAAWPQQRPGCRAQHCAGSHPPPGALPGPGQLSGAPAEPPSTPAACMHGCERVICMCCLPRVWMQ